MSRFRQALFLVATSTLSIFCGLSGCEDQEGLSGGTIKLGGTLSVPHGTCKTFAQTAQKFFLDQVTGGEREVLAAELKQRLDDALPTMIVDVRPLTEYSAAHIPSSINLPLDVLFSQPLCPNGNGCCDSSDHAQRSAADASLASLTSTSLTPTASASTASTAAGGDAPGPIATGGSRPGTCKLPVLPTDGTPIILVSSNGHAAAMAAGMLGTIGYNVYVLRFGMISWVTSSDVKVFRSDRNQRIQGLGGAVEL